MADLARLTQIIEPEAAALGFDVVRVIMTGSEAGDGERALQIMAEDPATGQLLIEQCAALSRAVSASMDALEEDGEELIEGNYHLEVSSPGIDRPLTRAKDFAAWSGHEAKIALTEKIDDQRNVRGKLLGIEGDVITIEDKQAKQIAVPLGVIHSAKLILTDELIAATRPLDISGVEEMVSGDDEINVEEKADD